MDHLLSKEYFDSFRNGRLTLKQRKFILRSFSVGELAPVNTKNYVKQIDYGAICVRKKNSS